MLGDYIEIAAKKQSSSLHFKKAIFWLYVYVFYINIYKNHLSLTRYHAIVALIMKIQTTLSPIDALKWYAAMDVDAVLSTDPNRWVVKAIAPKLGSASTLHSVRNDNKSNVIPEFAQQISGTNKEQNGVSSRSLVDDVTTLEQLKESLLSFNGCDLKKTATNTVFSDGISTSKIMFIGEAPGASEDATGIPFCGDSGKLLDNMISTIGLSRQKNIYITNTIFWRPPANRRPTQDEVEMCRPFVEKHIALIQPDLLILVGATAVTSLLGDLQISKIRQEYYQYQNQYLTKSITTTALFHPAYLMRQPFQKKATWYDLLKIQEFLGG